MRAAGSKPTARASLFEKRFLDGDPEDPDPAEGVRLQAARSVGRRDRRDGEAHRREGGGSHPAPDADQQVHGAPLAARRQEVSRTVRDPDAQAPVGHPRAHAADARRAHEARPERGRRRGDQELAMATFDVINLAKKKVGTIELADAVVNASLENAEALFYETVKAQLASRRSGTHAVKNRSLVSGGGKKPWRQKGTGRARQGSIRASQWVGGGKAMGPKPREYEYHVPKKMRKAALRAAISRRNADKALYILDKWTPEKPSTKAAVQAFEKLGLGSALVIDQPNEALFKSIRNAKKFQFLPAAGANVYDILRHQALVLTQAGAKALEGALS